MHTDPAPAPPAPVEATAPYRHPVHVRWSDQDAFGHVNNAKFAQYLQETMASWQLEHPDVGVMVAKAQAIEFKVPLTFHGGQDVYVDAHVEQIRTRSIRLHFDIRDDDVLYASAHAVFVAVDPATASSRNLTDAERAHLSRHLITQPDGP